MSKRHEKHRERVGLISSMGRHLARRSGSCCELCAVCGVPLGPWEVPPLLAEPELDRTIFVCAICKEQLTHPKKVDPKHWHCLHHSVWSKVPAVQVTSVAMLRKLIKEDWAEELLEQVYVEPEVIAWIDAALLEDWS